MKTTVVQWDCRFGDLEFNFNRAIELMDREPADVYVLPELCLSGYNFKDRNEVKELSEESHGTYAHRFMDFTRSRNCFVAYGFAEKASEEIYNSANLIGPDGLVGTYRKIHLYNRETLFFLPGRRPFKVYETSVGKLGLMVCFDWFFPESARTLALLGTELILHPSNLVLSWCPDAMRYHALWNGVYTATANRTGREDRGGQLFEYIGRSIIYSPDGKILTEAPHEREGIYTAEIDLSFARNKKLNRYNEKFQDRQPEFYFDIGLT